MNNHFEAPEMREMRENLQAALMQCYDLLFAKMQGDYFKEGKIFRLTVADGFTEEGEPLHLTLELNLQPKSFQPLHSIITLKELPFNIKKPHQEAYEIHVEDLLSYKMD